MYAEPDIVQSFPFRGPDDIPVEALESAAPCQESGPDPFWPTVESRFAWHLNDDFSELSKAHSRVGDPQGQRVRIAILDTGYDPEHVTLPLHLLTDLQRNFADGDPNDATDPGRHFPLDNPGHGTATLALLAGNRVRHTDPNFNDLLGGAPYSEVVPVRIANSVIHFYTSAMAAGIQYAIEKNCDVVSISMGGVPTRAWAEAVNRAYEAGVAIFAAAGNRIGPSPPRWIVYPARFNRVVAVCGVTADGTPYYREGFHRHMQGCFGPPAKMTTALATFTPNTPWAKMGCRELVNLDGAGTSAATPQAAAAAALWLQRVTIPDGIEAWQRVEAVRYALFSSADKPTSEDEKYFGQGLLRASRALDVPFKSDLPQTAADSVSFPWLRILGALEAVPVPTGRELMYEVEALQIYLQSPNLQDLTAREEPLTGTLDEPKRKQLIGALSQSPLASQALRKYLRELLT
jgi:subtilisin family serine protease